MSKKPKTQPVDDDNPEWTAQQAAAAKRFAELPATLQSKLVGQPMSAAFGHLQRDAGRSYDAQNSVICPAKEPAMGFSARDVVPFTQARANLSELADQAKAGAEKIITKNGESYVALIDANRLDYYHRLERERIHLLLIDDARRGIADIEAGRTYGADAAIAQLQQRRAATPAGKTAKKRG
jgi:prevent-host-death family protein